MSLADFQPARESVTFNGGEFSVRGLALDDVTVLMRHHMSDVDKLVEAFSSNDSTPEYAAKIAAQHIVTLVKEAPGLVANLIALASDEPDSVENARRLGIAVQIRALETIAKLTFDEAGGPKKFVESLVALLRGLRPPQ